MKATTDAASLRELAEWCERITPKRPPYPILGAVVLAVTADGIEAAVTDYETWGRATIPAVADSETTMAVSARLLAQVVGAVAGKGNGRVELETVSGGRLRVSCRTMKATLPVLPDEDFPAQPPEVPLLERVVSGPLLAEALTHALAAAERDDALPMLWAVQFESTVAGLRLAATDKYRITVADVPWLEPVDYRHHPIVLVSRPAVEALARSARTTDRLTIGLPEGGTGTAVFRTPGRTVRTRLLADSFPKYQPLIPDPAKESRWWSADAADLADLARTVGGLAHDVTDKGEKIVGRLRLTIGNGMVTAEAVGEDEATGSIPAEHSDGWDVDPWAIGVNAVFLADAAASVACARVRFSHTTALKAFRYDPDGEPAYPVHGVLMPVRLPATAESRSAA